jgi:hypothetical protein
MAQSFDLYAFSRISVSYKPLTGTDTEGAVYIAFDPDPLDPAPTTKSQLMSFGGATSCPVWKELNFHMPCVGQKYVRRGEVSNSTLHSYDYGTLYIATEGPPNQALGDLYVDYTVNFSLPHLKSPDLSTYLVQHFYPVHGTVTAAATFGTGLSYRGSRILEYVSYTADKVLKLKVVEAASYDNAGTRNWRVALDGVVNGSTMTSLVITSDSDYVTSTAPFNVASASSTYLNCRYMFVYTEDPTGTHIIVTYVGSVATTSSLTAFTGELADAFDLNS